MNGDILATMAAEIDECVELLRPHYPKAKKDQLRVMAMSMRDERYRTGRWPSDKELHLRAVHQQIADDPDSVYDPLEAA